MAALWAVTDDKVNAVVKRIAETVHPRKIIIFGSYARGGADGSRDLDVLVVVGDDVENTRAESVRIRRSLRGIPMPMDILVVSEHELRELQSVPGLVYQEAVDNGRVSYDAAST